MDRMHAYQSISRQIYITDAVCHPFSAIPLLLGAAPINSIRHARLYKLIMSAGQRAICVPICNRLLRLHISAGLLVVVSFPCSPFVRIPR